MKENNEVAKGVPVANPNNLYHPPRASREHEGPFLTLKYYIKEPLVRHLRSRARRPALSMASMMSRG